MFSICFLYFRLQALEAFIHTQRQLLERQRSDIDKLYRLRVDLCARPAQVLANLSNEVSFFFFVSGFLSRLSVAFHFSFIHRKIFLAYSTAFLFF